MNTNTLKYEQQCLGDDVADVVTPSKAFSLPCYYTLLFVLYNDVRDVVSKRFCLLVGVV